MSFKKREMDNIYLSSKGKLTIENAFAIKATTDTIKPVKQEAEVLKVDHVVRTNEEQQQDEPQKVKTEEGNGGESEIRKADKDQGSSSETEQNREQQQPTDTSRVAPTRVATPTPPTDPLPTRAHVGAIDIRQQTILGPLELDTLPTIDSLELARVDLQEATKGISSYSLDEQIKGDALPIKLDRINGVFVLLLICFLLLAHIYRGGLGYLKENMMLVFSSSQGERLEKQTTTRELFNSYFLLLLAIFLMSISLYEGFERLLPIDDVDKRPMITLVLFVGLISIFVIARMVLNRLIGYIFELDKRLSAWNQTYMVLISILGILSFFPILILIYSNLWDNIILGFVLVLFLIVHVILIIRIIIFFISQRLSILYLIAYLCTVEILPYLFLAIGLVYIYNNDIFNTIL